VFSWRNKMAAGTIQSIPPAQEQSAVLTECPPKALHPLQGRDFRRFWLGSLVSLIGDQFYLVAMPWLALQTSGSGFALGTVLMIAAGPRAVLMLVGGAASDRTSPRAILLITAWVRSFLVLMAGLLVYHHLIQLWEIYLLAAAFGCADAFSYPAGAAMLPTLVAKEQLPAANSMTMAATQLSLILGPLLAGLVVKLWGMPWAFLMDALSFMVLIAALMGLREKPGPRATQPANAMRHLIAEGLRYATQKPALRSLLVLAAAVNFCVAGPVMVGLAELSKQRYGSISMFGVFISALSFGALAGAIVPSLMKRPARHGMFVLAICMVLGAGMLLLGWLSHSAAIIVTLTAMGAGSGWINVDVQSWLQAEVERQMVGRVISLLMFAMVGLAPLSYVAAGALVQVSLALTFGVAGLLVLAVVAVAAWEGSIQSI
jgi:MFS family permease